MGLLGELEGGGSLSSNYGPVGFGSGHEYALTHPKFARTVTAYRLRRATTGAEHTGDGELSALKAQAYGPESTLSPSN